jgi:hypothetical protein
MTKERIAGFMLGMSAGVAIGYYLNPRLAIGMDSGRPGRSKVTRSSGDEPDFRRHANSWDDLLARNAAGAHKTAGSPL